MLSLVGARRKKLLLKPDTRMLILLVIYILNYVSSTRHISFRRVFRYSLLTIDRNNAACAENSQKVRAVGDEPSIQCRLLTWF